MILQTVSKFDPLAWGVLLSRFPLHVAVLVVASILVSVLVILGCLGYLAPAAWGTGGTVTVAVCGFFAVAAALANRK